MIVMAASVDVKDGGAHHFASQNRDPHRRCAVAFSDP
jgi:hypothetical protein